MTFEHRHENKSCSACRDRVNERVKVAKVAKVAKVVKVAKVARVKVFQVFENIVFLVKTTFATFTTFTTFTLSFTLSRHAEQLLFSCLCSKVTLTLFQFQYFCYFHYFHKFHPLIHSLSTWWTTLVFMSMLKSRCFLAKIARGFFGQHQHYPILWI